MLTTISVTLPTRETVIVWVSACPSVRCRRRRSSVVEHVGDASDVIRIGNIVFGFPGIVVAAVLVAALLLLSRRGKTTITCVGCRSPRYRSQVVAGLERVADRIVVVAAAAADMGVRRVAALVAVIS